MGVFSEHSVYISWPSRAAMHATMKILVHRKIVPTDLQKSSIFPRVVDTPLLPTQMTSSGWWHLTPEAHDNISIATNSRQVLQQTWVDDTVKFSTNAASHAPLNNAHFTRHVLYLVLWFYHFHHVLETNHVELCLQQRCDSKQWPYITPD